MKNFIKTIAFIGGCLFIIPFIIVYASGSYQSGDLLGKLAVQSEAATEAEDLPLVEKEKIIGILAKEIPYTYEYEAIKAQAVIIRTYIARRMLGIQNKGELTGYSEEDLKEAWGENYTNIYSTYEQAVKETGSEMILYNGEPIEAVYHKASGGKTRSAKDVYAVEVPYLQSVVSEGDTPAAQVELSKSKIAEKLKEVYPDIVLDPNEMENQIQIVEKDEAEYVKSIQMGNMVIKGEEFRKILGLPSSNFKIFKHKDSLIFDVKGEGHGVGLSQDGANEMAKNGKNYKEIIEYYYKGVITQNYPIKNK